MKAYLMDLKKLGELIRQKREELGIPPAVLARKVGIGRSTLWILERGENPRTGKPTRPGKDVLERLAQALRLNQKETEALMEWAGYVTLRPSPSQEDDDDGLRGMDEELQEYVERLKALDVTPEQLAVTIQILQEISRRYDKSGRQKVTTEHQETSPAQE